MDNSHADRLLPISDVCRQTTLSRAFIYDLVKRREFPPPIKLSPNRVAWSQSAVAGWIAAKISEAA